MKRQRKIEKDNRGVAIYARKSRITNKGDSIGVQFKQCVDYAKKELGLDEEYEFLQYEDKGLSGYFSDRPDFQRLLHDVQDGKIKILPTAGRAVRRRKGDSPCVIWKNCTGTFRKNANTRLLIKTGR